MLTLTPTGPFGRSLQNLILCIEDCPTWIAHCQAASVDPRHQVKVHKYETARGQLELMVRPFIVLRPMELTLDTVDRSNCLDVHITQRMHIQDQYRAVQSPDDPSRPWNWQDDTQHVNQDEELMYWQDVTTQDGDPVVTYDDNIVSFMNFAGAVISEIAETATAKQINLSEVRMVDPPQGVPRSEETDTNAYYFAQFDLMFGNT